jgi:hypothetical protein
MKVFDVPSAEVLKVSLQRNLKATEVNMRRGSKTSVKIS